MSRTKRARSSVRSRGSFPVRLEQLENRLVPGSLLALANTPVPARTLAGMIDDRRTVLRNTQAVFLSQLQADDAAHLLNDSGRSLLTVVSSSANMAQTVKAIPDASWDRTWNTDLSTVPMQAFDHALSGLELSQDHSRRGRHGPSSADHDLPAHQSAVAPQAHFADTATADGRHLGVSGTSTVRQTVAHQDGHRVVGTPDWHRELDLFVGALGAQPGSYLANEARGDLTDGLGSRSAPPDAVDDEVTTDEDTAASLYYLTYNDTDPDGDTLEIVAIGPPANGQVVPQPDQTYHYVPNPNWNGTDSFPYTVSDGQSTDTATVTVTVLALNDPPVADNKNVTTDQNTPTTVTLTGTDVEGSPLEFFIHDDPANGTLSELTVGTITYVPNGNFHGTDTFTYKATEGQLAGAEATVTVTVLQVAQGSGVTITASGGSTLASENDEVWADPTLNRSTHKGKCLTPQLAC